MTALAGVVGTGIVYESLNEGDFRTAATWVLAILSIAVGLAVYKFFAPTINR